MSIHSVNTMEAIQSLMDMNYTESMITFCTRFNQSSPIWNLERHSHIYTELLFFLRGKATIDTEAAVLSPTSYDIVMYFPNHEHHETIDLTKSQEVICIWIDTGNLPPWRQGAFCLHDVNHTMEWLFIQIEKEYKKKDPFSRKLVSSYLNAIIHNLLRQLTQSESVNTSHFVEKAQDYINNNFTRSISISRLAESCHISPSYLHKVFHRQVGMTPIQYITSLRIQQSEYLLESSTLSITEIAEHCGFEDARYFCRVFKKHKGSSPSQYRENSKIDLKTTAG